MQSSPHASFIFDLFIISVASKDSGSLRIKRRFDRCFDGKNFI